MSIEITPPNESGQTQSIVRWMTESEAGWVGSWSKDALESIKADQDKLEQFKNLASKLVPFRYQLSYNDSYFGEPTGLLKAIVAEFDRLIMEPITKNVSS